MIARALREDARLTSMKARKTESFCSENGTSKNLR